MSSAAPSPGKGPLAGLRIVESTAFIAAPLATMSLAALGAEVIRLDPPGGGLDYGRWPLSEQGASLYWTMLNRGKRSVTLDLRNEDGREAAARLICDGGGIFVTNLPARGALAPEALLARRPDAIVVTLDGSPDGATAIDYTVHAACGAALMSGPASHEAPINNAVPFWDVIAGRTLAMGLLAAELERQRSGRGQHIALSLSDIAMETMANLGILAETELIGRSRPKQGNWVYGSFGRDFETRCGRRFMLAVVTDKQWRGLLQATGLGAAMAHLGKAFGGPLDDDAARYRARHAIAALVQDWAGARDLAAIAKAFEGTAVCWSPYRSTAQMLEEDPRASVDNPLFERLAHPGVDPVLTPRNPFRMTNHPKMRAQAAPSLGADTAAVLERKERADPMTEYATQGLFGILTPQANTTAEAEIQMIAPPGMVPLTARMVSAKPSMDARLLEYVDGLGDTVSRFANAPLGAVALACTGMSYIVPGDQERAALDRIEQERGYPVITAAAAILTALEVLEARRVGILSPYGDPLHGQGLSFWASKGLEIVRTERLTGNDADFHPIYGMGSASATRGLEVLGTEGLDAILILGTGLPTLRTILARGGKPLPILTPNLALMWKTALVLSGQTQTREGLEPWLTGANWRDQFNLRMSADE